MMKEKELKKTKRQQLTLFLQKNDSLEIEKIRERFNAIQFKIIKSHITLCREDEIEQLEKIKINLKTLSLESFVLELGNPIRFSENKGVLIPIIGNEQEFHNLRFKILNEVVEKPKKQKPHITLIHPRNGSCTDEIFDLICNFKFPAKVRFSKISLIEQTNEDSWNVIEEYNYLK